MGEPSSGSSASSSQARTGVRGVLAGLAAGLAGGVAWFAGILLFFGPAQVILADPALQSAKMMAAFTEEPLPRAAEAPWLLIIGLLLIGMIWGTVYTWLARPWIGAGVSWLVCGLRFSAIGWALMVPWFVFYLPWNVLREPTWLAAIELMCWVGVMLCVGLTIAGVDRMLRSAASGPRAQPLAA